MFTHRQLPVISGIGLFFAHGDVRPVHEQMAGAADGRNIWLVGGAMLSQRFLELGLVDEIRLTVAPVLLGEGLRLFRVFDDAR